ISIIASVLLILFSEYIITFILGANWDESAIYVKMLTPLLVSMMIACPGVAAVRVFEVQKDSLKYSIVSLVVKEINLLTLFVYEIVEFEYIILIYSIVNLILVFANNSIILLKIKQYEKAIT